MADLIIRLEACEPMELMRNPFEQKVWIKLNPAPRNWWPEVEIRGEPLEVYGFIKDNWGVETAEGVINTYGRV